MQVDTTWYKFICKNVEHVEFPDTSRQGFILIYPEKSH